LETTADLPSGILLWALDFIPVYSRGTLPCILALMPLSFDKIILPEVVGNTAVTLQSCIDEGHFEVVAGFEAIEKPLCLCRHRGLVVPIGT